MIWRIYGLLILVFAAPMVIAAVWFRPPLWRWLFVAEAFLLLWSLANCFVPGSWLQFWELEIPVLAVGGAVAAISSMLRMREERRTGRERGWAVLPQMASFYVVLAVVGLIIAAHFSGVL